MVTSRRTLRRASVKGYLKSWKKLWKNAFKTEKVKETVDFFKSEKGGYGLTINFTPSFWVTSCNWNKTSRHRRREADRVAHILAHLSRPQSRPHVRIYSNVRAHRSVRPVRVSYSAAASRGGGDDGGGSDDGPGQSAPAKHLQTQVLKHDDLRGPLRAFRAGRCFMALYLPLSMDRAPP